MKSPKVLAIEGLSGKKKKKTYTHKNMKSALEGWLKW